MSYHRPQDLASALTIACTPGKTVIAGGTDVFPAQQQGRAFETLLDVTAITELAGITQGAAGYRIGAATTWSQVIKADLPPAFDALQTSRASGRQCPNPKHRHHRWQCLQCFTRR